MKIKFIDRICGAIRGFKDPLYENVPFELLMYNKPLDSGDRPQEKSIFYLCDGKKPECACGLRDILCGMTTDISHAKNFKDIGKSMNPEGPSIWIEVDEDYREED